MKQKNWQKIIYQLLSKNSSGFTLIDLLAAIVITGILAAGTSVGLTTILQENQEQEEQILRGQESNRALDFIREEIKAAQRIVPDTTDSADSDTNPTDFSKDCTNTSDKLACVLILNDPNLPQNIVYYTEPASDPWKGPRVLRRWGPDLKKDGSYSNSKPSKWSGNVLIDSIANDTEPDCDSGTKNGEEVSGEQGGVYSCVEGIRRAEIILVGNSEINSEDNYTVRGSTFARGNCKASLSSDASSGDKQVDVPVSSCFKSGYTVDIEGEGTNKISSVSSIDTDNDVTNDVDRLTLDSNLSSDVSSGDYIRLEM